jgi:hypothetical protein
LIKIKTPTTSILHVVKGAVGIDAELFSLASSPSRLMMSWVPMKARLVAQGRTFGSPDAHVAIAIFDNWAALRSVLNDIVGASNIDPSVIVLSKDLPSASEELGFPSETISFCISRAGLYATCSRGQLAQELALQMAHRPHTLAKALRHLLPLEQVGRLETYMEQGHVVLMLELRNNDELGTMCEKLVRHSPHLVRLAQRDFLGEH